MMRITLCIFILTGFGSDLHSQNLVRNHSFEKQNFTTGHSIPDHWFNPPEFVDSLELGMIGMHPNSPLVNWQPGLVDSAWSCRLARVTQYPYAYHEKAYLGLQLFDTLYIDFVLYPDSCCTNAFDSAIYRGTSWADSYPRSFASTRLKNSLLKDSTYVVEYAVHHCPFAKFGLITQDFGIQLTEDTLEYNDYRSQSLTNLLGPEKVISHDDGWVTLRQKYTAQGGEEFLTIGNFLPDSLSAWFITANDTGCKGEYNRPMQYYFDAIYLYHHRDTIFEVNLPPDTALCQGDSLRLFARHDDGFKLEDTTKSFEWSTGSTDSSISITGPGTYWVKVTYNNRWWAADTIVVEEIPPYETNLLDDTLICDHRSLRLQVPHVPGYQYHWSDGTNRHYTEVSDSGMLSIRVTTPCETVEDSVLVNTEDCTPEEPQVFIPDAFTPDGDGLNDYWKIENLPEENEVLIFSRWGTRLYHSSPYRPWDGTGPDGRQLPPGIYIYKITYTFWPGTTKNESGWVQIIR